MHILFYFYYNEAGAPGIGLPKNKACQTAVRNGKFRKAKRHVLDGETARFARQNGTFRNSTDYQALTQGAHTAGNGTKNKGPDCRAAPCVESETACATPHSGPMPPPLLPSGIK